VGNLAQVEGRLACSPPHPDRNDDYHNNAKRVADQLRFAHSRHVLIEYA
jgi:hypothetical protein